MTEQRSANFFDVLRVIAASMVIVGHAWPLSGSSDVPRYAGISVHHLGVYIFFAISGYLLARSWSRSSQPVPFMFRRLFRIFPALIVAITVTVVLLGPVFTRDAVAAYWASDRTWMYFSGAALMPSYDLPGVFTDNPNTAVNGSLWSLGPEFCCYLVLVVLGVLFRRFSRWARLAIALGLAISIWALPISGTARTTVIAVVFFALGSLVAELPERARIPLWLLPVPAVLLLPLTGTLGLIGAWLLVPLMIVSFGERQARFATWFRRGGDPSYGMYLYGFVVQQALIDQFGILPLLVSIVATLAVSAALGYLSWHLIERRAITAGSRLARRVRQPNVTASRVALAP